MSLIARGTFLMAILAAPAHAGTMADVLDRVWRAARDHICDSVRNVPRFTDERYAALAARADTASSLDVLADVLNPFLDSLGLSHARFVTRSDLDYALYRSMAMHSIDDPATWNIGIQSVRVAGRWVVKAAFEGGPAHRAGLRRGDVIVAADGVPFHPVRSFTSGAPVTLRVLRGNRALLVLVNPVHTCVQREMLEAMTHSLRRHLVAGRKVGYLHLWAGTAPEFLAEFRALIQDSIAGCDGLILDLRDGYGGAWQDYLDPLFPDRSGFFTTTVTGRTAEELVLEPDPNVPPHPYFAGKLVALINEGTRSGKEALAYQLKASRRATLVGAPTAGAFLGARYFFSDGQVDYALSIPVTRLRLDGHDLEGLGVAPDIPVGYAPGRGPGLDSQFARALDEMERLLRGRE